jgi:subtilisin family serine protease
MRLRSVGALGVLAILATLLLTVSAASGAPASERKSYIVVMAAQPLVAYDGDIAGFAATAPAAGEKVDSDSAASQKYAQHLVGQHNESLADAGVSTAEKINDYSVALNGYSAVMTKAQADAIRMQKGVVRVMEDKLQQPTTDSSGAFLGLTQPGGAYASGINGTGVTVGVIDTGIWPEHPSFSGAGFPAPVGLNGPIPCEFGNTAHNPNDAPFTCNNKLVGARQMLDTYRALIGAEDFEFDSARDDNGHGTHTSSTAAGNANVPAQTFGIPRGNITGIAPRAHVIMYKGLGTQGGFTSDLTAAIDQAVDDGVDVINYSIGGGASVTGSDDIAFLFAANAGVFVATSAGNSGNGAGTIGGPANLPWVTTVGANTQTRSFQGTVVLKNGAQYKGVSMTESLGKGGFLPQNYLLADAATNASGPTPDLCVSGTLLPTVKDKIVLCRRGGNARVDKSLAVMLAGGAGMILYENDDKGDLMSDPHFVPTVHVDNTPGLAIKNYINTARGPAAHLDNKQLGTTPWAASMTFFSSRGPTPITPDLIKPDITAPGIQILAGNSPFPGPEAPAGELFQAIAGTSMSSPHIAGIYALMKQAFGPTFPAAAAKSALMTSAHQNVRDNDRVTIATPFAMGAGHANPGKPGTQGSMFQPGLIYNTSITANASPGPGGYVAFMCGVDPGLAEALVGNSTFCDQMAADGRDKGYNLNVPSIGVAEVAGSETVKRRVTNITGGTATFTAAVTAPPGYTAVVSPSSLTLANGAAANFTVTFTNVSAPIGEWRFGSLTWTSGAYVVRSPIALKGAKFNAPAEIKGTGASGTASFPVKFGYTGAYAAVPSGLTAATLTNATVKQDPNQTFAPSDVGNGATLHTFNLSNAAVFRVAIPPEATEASADLDVYVYNPSDVLVATSTLGGTDEEVTIQSPANGAWKVYVHGWQTIGPDSAYTLYSWAVPSATGGSLVVNTPPTPTSATLGTTGTVQVSWTGAGGTWNLGAVTHKEGAAGATLGRTLVEVDNRP